MPAWLLLALTLSGRGGGGWISQEMGKLSDNLGSLLSGQGLPPRSCPSLILLTF